MRPASKRRGKREEEVQDESDEDAPLAEVSRASTPGSSHDLDTSNGKRSAKNSGKKEIGSDNESDVSEKKRSNDKRRSAKKLKYGESDDDDEDKETSDESGSDEKVLATPAKKAKESNATKEKTPKKEKGKRGRKPKAKRPVPEPTNGDVIDEIDDKDYEVEDILDQRVKFSKLQYLIRWKGYGPQHDTWERADGLNCPDIIKKFKQNLKDKRDAESSGDEKTEEFEVSHIKEVHFKRDGSREFLVGWKGYGAKDDTWEHEKNMKCPEIIAKFMRKVDQAKEVTLRELREHREPTKHYTANSFQVLGRRLSGRSKDKPRVNYFYGDQY